MGQMVTTTVYDKFGIENVSFKATWPHHGHLSCYLKNLINRQNILRFSVHFNTNLTAPYCGDSALLKQPKIILTQFNHFEGCTALSWLNLVNNATIAIAQWSNALIWLLLERVFSSFDWAGSKVGDPSYCKRNSQDHETLAKSMGKYQQISMIEQNSHMACIESDRNCSGWNQWKWVLKRRVNSRTSVVKRFQSLLYLFFADIFSLLSSFLPSSSRMHQSTNICWL